MSRLDAVQRWPVEKKALLTAGPDGDAEIGVVMHDHRVLAAHLELHLGAAGDAIGRDLAAVSTEPVKLTRPTCGERTMALPTCEPDPSRG
jgi:hypothetical protein